MPTPNRNRTRTGTWNRRTNRRTSTTSRTTRTTRTTNRTTTTPTTGYRTCSTNFQRTINSYRTLYNQTRGPARYNRPTPTTLNNFARWINKGAIIQTVSNAQIGRWAKTYNMNWNNKNPTVSACKTILSKKFGKDAIKAVARTKTGSFMVATPHTYRGKTFNFPR